jgi:hypothetical protein
MDDVGTAIFIRLGHCGRSWTHDVEAPGVGCLRNVSIDNVVANIANHPRDDRPLCCSVTGLPGHPVENVSISNVKLTTRRAHRREEAELNAREVEERPRDYPEYSMFGPLPAYGFFCRHVRDLSFRNVDFRFEQEDYRSALVFDDVEGLELDGLRARALPGGKPVLVLHDVADALIRGAVAREGTPTFLTATGRTARVLLSGNELGRAAVPVALAPDLPDSTVRVVP